MNPQFDPQQFEQNPIGEMNRLIGRQLIRKTVTELPLSLIERFPDQKERFDGAFITRYALTLWRIAFITPATILAQAPDLFQMVLELMDNLTDTTSSEHTLNFFRRNLTRISPTMAQAYTDEVVMDAAKLLLLDWLQHGRQPDDPGKLSFDTHFYFLMAADAHGVHPDTKRGLREAIASTRRNPILAHSPAIRKALAEMEEHLNELDADSDSD